MSQPQTILYLVGLSVGLLGLVIGGVALVCEKRTVPPEARERTYRQRMASLRQDVFFMGAAFGVIAFFVVLASLGVFLSGNVAAGIALVACAVGLLLFVGVITGAAWWLIRWVARGASRV